jgi:DNA-binding GntR family transcriptional regulator
MEGPNLIITKRDHIAQQLRDLISAGEIPRGAHLRQDELAERFQTSITPVREAMRILQAEGLLVAEPRRGVRVASVDIPQLQSNYVVRRLVETYAMKRATRRMSPRDLGKARAINESMAAAHRAGDNLRVRTANREFHFFFIDRCGLPGLVDHVDDLWLGFPWDILQVLVDRVPCSVSEHEDILRAVELGDLDEVAAATERHLANSFLALVEHLTGQRPEDPFDLDSD